jgi:hypothetical protein
MTVNRATGRVAPTLNAIVVGAGHAPAKLIMQGLAPFQLPNLIIYKYVSKFNKFSSGCTRLQRNGDRDHSKKRG